jgi:hypothetical protein
VTTHPTPLLPAADAAAPVQVRARRDVIRHLGQWTTADRFDVRVSDGAAVLDLLLPRIDADEVNVRLDVDRGVVTLLVPDGARVVDDELRWAGPGRLRDWTGAESPDGMVIRLAGEVRRGQVRIRRGGLALLSLIGHGKAGDVRRAYATGNSNGQAAAR